MLKDRADFGAVHLRQGCAGRSLPILFALRSYVVPSFPFLQCKKAPAPWRPVVGHLFSCTLISPAPIRTEEISDVVADIWIKHWSCPNLGVHTTFSLTTPSSTASSRTLAMALQSPVQCMSPMPFLFEQDCRHSWNREADRQRILTILYPTRREGHLEGFERLLWPRCLYAKGTVSSPEPKVVPAAEAGEGEIGVLIGSNMLVQGDRAARLGFKATHRSILDQLQEDLA